MLTSRSLSISRLCDLGNYIGYCRITGYNFVRGQCPDDRGHTASGRPGVLGLSAAADARFWNIKQGNYIFVEGSGLWRIDDTGSAIKGRERFDLACGGYPQAHVLNGFHRVWYIGQLRGKL